MMMYLHHSICAALLRLAPSLPVVSFDLLSNKRTMSVTKVDGDDTDAAEDVKGGDDADDPGVDDNAEEEAEVGLLLLLLW